MRRLTRRFARMTIAVFILFALTNCAAQVRTGPTVAVYPGDAKSPMEFEQNAAYCKQQATLNAGDPNSAQEAQAGSAIGGAMLGALLGGIAGGGRGAGIGAASGLFAGTLYGSGSASAGATQIQQRWDIQYQVCMFNLGNKVPGFQTMERPAALMPPPPPPSSPMRCTQTGKYTKTPQGDFVAECK